MLSAGWRAAHGRERGFRARVCTSSTGWTLRTQIRGRILPRWCLHLGHQYGDHSFVDDSRPNCQRGILPVISHRDVDSLARWRMISLVRTEEERTPSKVDNGLLASRSYLSQQMICGSFALAALFSPSASSQSPIRCGPLSLPGQPARSKVQSGRLPIDHFCQITPPPGPVPAK